MSGDSGAIRNAELRVCFSSSAYVSRPSSKDRGICYSTDVMATKDRADLEMLIEQKIEEYLGDPDEGLKPRPGFLAELRRRMKKKQKYTPMSAVAKKYGLQFVQR